MKVKMGGEKWSLESFSQENPTFWESLSGDEIWRKEANALKCEQSLFPAYVSVAV